MRLRSSRRRHILAHQEAHKDLVQHSQVLPGVGGWGYRGAFEERARLVWPSRVESELARVYAIVRFL